MWQKSITMDHTFEHLQPQHPLTYPPHYLWFGLLWWIWVVTPHVHIHHLTHSHQQTTPHVRGDADKELVSYHFLEAKLTVEKGT